MRSPPALAQPNTVVTSEAQLARQRLFTALAAIPAGKVISYGQLASLAGCPGAARWAGSCLRQLPAASQLPWHRVLRASGQLALAQDCPGHDTQCQRLAAEGILVNQGKINMRIYGYLL